MHGLSCIKGEIQSIMILMKSYTKWSQSLKISNDGTNNQEEDSFIYSFRRLNEYLERCHYIHEIDCVKYIQPFYRIIVSDKASGLLTSTALLSLSKFVLYGFLNINNNNSNRAQEGMYLISQCIAHCVFEETDWESDELILMKLLELSVSCYRSDASNLLTIEATWDIYSTCISIYNHYRASKILKSEAETALRNLTLSIFIRLKNGIDGINSNNNSNSRSLSNKLLKLDHIKDISWGSIQQSFTIASAVGLTLIVSKIMVVLCDMVDIQKLSIESLKLALSLMNVALETGGEGLASVEPLVGILQSDVCRHLLRATQSDDLMVLNLSFRVIYNLFKCMKGHMKVQLEVFLISVHLRFINYRLSTNPSNGNSLLNNSAREELSLEALVELCRDHHTISYFYQSYDCDLYGSNVFESIVQTLCIRAVPSTAAILMNGNDKKSTKSYQALANSVDAFDSQTSSYTRFSLVNKVALEGLLNILHSISVIDNKDYPSKEKEEYHEPIVLPPNSNVLVVEDIIDEEVDKWCNSDDTDEILSPYEQINQLPNLLNNNSNETDHQQQQHNWKESYKQSSKSFLSRNSSYHTSSTTSIATYNNIAVHEEVDSKLQFAQYLREKKILKQKNKIVCDLFNQKPLKPDWIHSAINLGIFKVYNNMVETDDNIYNQANIENISTIPSTNSTIVEPSTGIDAITIARFLRYNIGLDKSQIGEYISKGPPDRYPFHALVLKEYANTFDFSGENSSFHQAIRIFLSEFKLPGEAQCIDRLMEAFAGKLYHDLGPNRPFATGDAAFILAFSTIMLNTDLHNPQIPYNKKMTKLEFIRNNRGINDGKDLPIEYLETLYDEIKTKQIQVNVDINDTLYSNLTDFSELSNWNKILDKSNLAKSKQTKINTEINNLKTKTNNFKLNNKLNNTTSCQYLSLNHDLFIIMAKPTLETLIILWDLITDDQIISKLYAGIWNYAIMCLDCEMHQLFQKLIFILCAKSKDLILRSRNIPLKPYSRLNILANQANYKQWKIDSNYDLKSIFELPFDLLIDPYHNTHSQYSLSKDDEDIQQQLVFVSRNDTNINNSKPDDHSHPTSKPAKTKMSKEEQDKGHNEGQVNWLESSMIKGELTIKLIFELLKHSKCIISKDIHKSVITLLIWLRSRGALPLEISIVEDDFYRFEKYYSQSSKYHPSDKTDDIASEIIPKNEAVMLNSNTSTAAVIGETNTSLAAAISPIVNEDYKSSTAANSSIYARNCYLRAYGLILDRRRIANEFPHDIPSLNTNATTASNSTIKYQNQSQSYHPNIPVHLSNFHKSHQQNQQNSWFGSLGGFLFSNNSSSSNTLDEHQMRILEVYKNGISSTSGLLDLPNLYGNLNASQMVDLHGNPIRPDDGLLKISIKSCHPEEFLFHSKSNHDTLESNNSFLNDVKENDLEILSVMSEILDYQFEKLLHANTNKTILIQSIKSNISKTNHINVIKERERGLESSPVSSIKTTNSNEDDNSSNYHGSPISLSSSLSPSLSMINTIYEDEYHICTTISNTIDVINITEKLLDNINELDIVAVLEWICKILFSNYILLQKFWPKMHNFFKLLFEEYVDLIAFQNPYFLERCICLILHAMVASISKCQSYVVNNNNDQQQEQQFIERIMKDRVNVNVNTDIVAIWETLHLMRSVPSENISNLSDRLGAGVLAIISCAHKYEVNITLEQWYMLFSLLSAATSNSSGKLYVWNCISFLINHELVSDFNFTSCRNLILRFLQCVFPGESIEIEQNNQKYLNEYPYVIPSMKYLMKLTLMILSGYCYDHSEQHHSNTSKECNHKSNLQEITKQMDQSSFIVSHRNNYHKNILNHNYSLFDIPSISLIENKFNANSRRNNPEKHIFNQSNLLYLDLHQKDQFHIDLNNNCDNKQENNENNKGQDKLQIENNNNNNNEYQIKIKTIKLTRQEEVELSWFETCKLYAIQITPTPSKSTEIAIECLETIIAAASLSTLSPMIWIRLLTELMTRLPLSLISSSIGTTRSELTIESVNNYLEIMNNCQRSCSIIFHLIVKCINQIKDIDHFKPLWTRYISILSTNAQAAYRGQWWHEDMLDTLEALLRLLKLPTIPINIIKKLEQSSLHNDIITDKYNNIPSSDSNNYKSNNSNQSNDNNHKISNNSYFNIFGWISNPAPPPPSSSQPSLLKNKVTSESLENKQISSTDIKVESSSSISDVDEDYKNDLELLSIEEFSHDGELLIVAWKTMCSLYPTFPNYLKQKDFKIYNTFLTSINYSERIQSLIINNSKYKKDTIEHENIKVIEVKSNTFSNTPDVSDHSHVEMNNNLAMNKIEKDFETIEVKPFKIVDTKEIIDNSIISPTKETISSVDIESRTLLVQQSSNFTNNNQSSFITPVKSIITSNSNSYFKNKKITSKPQIV